MTVFQIVSASVMLIMVAIAVYTDVRAGRIYNALTAPCVVLGLVLNTVNDGVDGLAFSLAGVGLGLGVYLLSSLLLGRILGGGDVKLLMAIGAIQGPQFLAWTCIYMALIGGVLAILWTLRYNDFFGSLQRLWAGLVLRVCARVRVDVNDATSDSRLPYAIPIALGSLVALYVLKLQ